MDTGGRLVAGSHNRNEFVVINAEEIRRVKSFKELSGQICEICADDIELTAERELFVACNECAFPVCRNCYEYERREGTQACPQCNTRYKRIKGTPRVEGDEEEEDFDDLENEFDFRSSHQGDPQHIAEAMLSVRLNVGSGSNGNAFGDAVQSDFDSSYTSPGIPLLTYKNEDAVVSPDHHAVILPPLMGRNRIHPIPFLHSSLSLPPRPMAPKKDLSLYGYGTVAWKGLIDEWKKKQNDKLHVNKHQGGKFDMNDDGDESGGPDFPRMDEARQPLSRKLPIPSSKINPYRLIILLRLVVLGFFFHYRLLHPVHDAYGLWLTSVICEIWFAVSWILDQFPKWCPIERETYLDRLSLRYEKKGKPSELADIDVFVSTVDPLKEPPLITANTVLSILAVDYPVHKVACYVSDDGADMLTFEALSETAIFAKKWVPFCKKFNIEPRAPEWYFTQKIDYLKDKIYPAFVRERRAIKREYEEFKVKINALVATAEKVPDDGWTMQDGTPWPGNNVRDHPAMIQVFLGQNGDCDVKGSALPSQNGVDDVKGSALPCQNGVDDVKGSALPRQNGVDDVKGSALPRQNGADDVKGSALPHQNGAGDVKGSALPRQNGAGDVKGSALPHQNGAGDIKGSALPRQNGAGDLKGSALPLLVYVSREKRPSFDHHKKAGAMNALVRVSAIISNAPFLLNVDCDHYINNSKALREAMCFLMDPISGKKVCYVQFPQRFDGIDLHDRYSNRNVVFFDINMKGLDGIQGPIYVGTGCVFRRQALYGYDAPVTEKRSRKTCNCWPKWCCLSCGSRRKNRETNSKKEKKKKMKHRESSNQIHALENIEEGVEGMDSDKSLLMSQRKFEKKFGQSPVFITSTLLENGGNPQTTDPSTLLKEAIHVISCGYEDKTEWGNEVGWTYGSVTEDILTGFKMHCHGWRSVYCIPRRPAFKGSAPINLSDRLHQVLRWALGSVEIFMSKHCPIWYGYGCGLKRLERLSYINSVVYPWTSIPLIAYCTLPAVCLLTGDFIIPEISNYASIVFMALFISIAATGIIEMQWGGVGIDDWWRNEQFWVIGGVSSHLFALFQGLLKVLAGVSTNFTVTSKGGDDGEYSELYLFKWTSLLIPPMTLLIINIIGVIVGISDAISTGYESWGPLFGKLFFAFWVIVHLYPFLRGLMGKQDRLPTIILVWSFLLASIFSLLWVRINPFLAKSDIILEVCGLDCD